MKQPETKRKGPFCRKCGEELIPHPNVKNFPVYGQIRYDIKTGEPIEEECEDLRADYMICRTGKCDHWGMDHEYIYPSIWEIIKNRGKEIVKCKNCEHTHEMWQGH